MAPACDGGGKGVFSRAATVVLLAERDNIAGGAVGACRPSFCPGRAEVGDGSSRGFVAQPVEDSGFCAWEGEFSGWSDVLNFEDEVVEVVFDGACETTWASGEDGFF